MHDLEIPYVLDGGTISAVEEWEEVVGRMGNNPTEDACKISTRKTDCQLDRLAALVFWFGHHMLVYCLHYRLKRGELHHSIYQFSYY